MSETLTTVIDVIKAVRHRFDQTDAVIDVIDAAQKDHLYNPDAAGDDYELLNVIEKKFMVIKEFEAQINELIEHFESMRTDDIPADRLEVKPDA